MEKHKNDSWLLNMCQKSPRRNINIVSISEHLENAHNIIHYCAFSTLGNPALLHWLKPMCRKSTILIWSASISEHLENAQNDINLCAFSTVSTQRVSDI